MQTRLKRYGKGLLFAVLVATIGIAGDVVYLVAKHNLHVVTPENIYRSGRMSAAALAETMQTHGIKSVVSLIGTNDVEMETVQRRGANYFAFSLSDRQEVTDAQMDDIVAKLREMPKPLLIHCNAGADRAGLASALYRYAIEGQPADQAEDSLALLYGHLPPWLGFGSRAMDESFWRYAASHSPGCGTNQLN